MKLSDISVRRPVFADVGPAAELDDGELRSVPIDGIGVLLAGVDGEVYAFRDACAVDGLPLAGGRLTDSVVVCYRLAITPDRLLGRVESVRTNIALTTQVLGTIRAEQWAELTGLVATIERTVAQAWELGSVPDSLWQSIAGSAAVLEKQRDLYRDNIRKHVRQIEGERKALLKREARDRATAEAQQAQMKDLRLTFERKVGEHGMLYGSVTSMHIAEALREKGYEVDRRRVHLQEPIKETGDFAVTVRLHRDVNVEIPVTVTGEGDAQTSGAADAATEEATGGEATVGVEANGASTENA